jgi:transcriptional regulator with XRE-family HTH domain
MLDSNTTRRPRGRTPSEFVDLHVGERLRQRRIVLGLTQQELAARVGVTCQQAHKYEKGVNRLSAARLFNLAGALEVDVGFFFEGLDAGPTPRWDARQRLVQEVERHLVAVPNPRVQELICELVRALAEENAGSAIDDTSPLHAVEKDARAGVEAPGDVWPAGGAAAAAIRHAGGGDPAGAARRDTGHD